MFGKQKQKYTKEQLQSLVEKSDSVADVVRLLGLKPAGGNISHIAKVLKSLAIDTSRFTGQAHRKGQISLHRKTAEEILKRVQIRTHAHLLRRALIERGREHKCETCTTPPVWNGKPLVLQVDHMDGDALNNEEGNLRFLCPNCHSQTANFGSKNKGTVP